jgi:putative transcriptional regulator
MKNRLEEMRKERGIKQEELAISLEVKIARYFNVSIEDIFIYEEEEK